MKVFHPRNQNFPDWDPDMTTDNLLSSEEGNDQDLPGEDSDPRTESDVSTEY